MLFQGKLLLRKEEYREGIQTYSDYKIINRPYTGSLGIAGVVEEIGGIGRVEPAQYPHIFPSITAIAEEPIYEAGNTLWSLGLMTYWTMPFLFSE
jgi:hypothetical protein